jgi:hypothetical protein
MLLDWAKKNLETLNSEMARQYLLEEVIPNCRRMCEGIFQDIGISVLNHQEFI